MASMKAQGSPAASGPAKLQQAKGGGGKPATKAVQKPQEPKKVTAPKAAAAQSGPKAPAQAK